MSTYVGHSEACNQRNFAIFKQLRLLVTERDVLVAIRKRETGNFKPCTLSHTLQLLSVAYLHFMKEKGAVHVVFENALYMQMEPTNTAQTTVGTCSALMFFLYYILPSVCECTV